MRRCICIELRLISHVRLNDGLDSMSAARRKNLALHRPRIPEVCMRLSSPKIPWRSCLFHRSDFSRLFALTCYATSLKSLRFVASFGGFIQRINRAILFGLPTEAPTFLSEDLYPDSTRSRPHQWGPIRPPKRGLAR